MTRGAAVSISGSGFRCRDAHGRGHGCGHSILAASGSKKWRAHDAIRFRRAANRRAVGVEFSYSLKEPAGRQRYGGCRTRAPEHTVPLFGAEMREG